MPIDKLVDKCYYVEDNRTKSNDEDRLGKAFLREPGAVEARQTAANVLIPSELRPPKHGK